MAVCSPASGQLSQRDMSSMPIDQCTIRADQSALTRFGGLCCVVRSWRSALQLPGGARLAIGT